MSLKNVKPTQVRIEDTRVVEFFDNKFVGLINKHFDDLDFLHFAMHITDKEKNETKERLAIFHLSRDNEKNGVLTVDADHPESLQKLLNVIEEYKKDR